jgi:putative ABC transport system permease protein
MQASRVDLRDAIAEGGRTGQPGIRRRTRRAFVAVEIAMATLLLMGSGLLARSFLRLVRVDPGFIASGALATDIALPQARYPNDADAFRFLQQIIDRVASLPGVKAVGVTETLPLGGSIVHDLTIEGRPPVGAADQPAADYYTVTPGYFAAMGIRLMRGRLFTEEDSPDAPRVAIISETFASELFRGEDPLGRRVKLSVDPDTWREVVGIVGDTKQYGLAAASTKQFYEPSAQAPASGGALVVRTSGDASSLAASVRGIVHALDPELPIGPVRALDSLIAESIAPQRFSMLLLGAFAVSAIFLAAIGLYSVISYSVNQRTREVGIRVAHGAQRGDIVWLVLREGLGLALAGVVVGLAASLAAGQLVASLLFGVTTTDPLTWAAVLVGLFAIAALACTVPAYRAARVDPIVTLRSV